MYLLQALTVNPTCSLCRKNIRVEDLTLNTRKGDQILKVAEKIFRRLERVFEQLPEKDSILHYLSKKIDGTSQNPLDLADPILVENIAASINEGEKLVGAPIDDLVDKIKGTTPLSLSESYALGHYLIYQFKPVQQKIGQAYRKTHDYLFDIHVRGRLSAALFAARSQELTTWYLHFKERLIPQECKIVRALYNL